MSTYESEAIVLRHYTLSDADRIVVLVTREHGKVRGTARGLKKLKSHLAASLEPLNHVRVTFWARQESELCRITGCEKIHAYLGRKSTLEQFFAYNYFAEIIDVCVQENNPNYLLFRLFLAVLRAGESVGVSESLVRYFELWTLRLNGLLPEYDYCSGCHKYVSGIGFYAAPDTGQGYCSECHSGHGVRVRAAATEVLRSILAFTPEQFLSTPFPADVANDVERLIQHLFDLHLQRRFKSYDSLLRTLKGS